MEFKLSSKVKVKSFDNFLYPVGVCISLKIYLPYGTFSNFAIPAESVFELGIVFPSTSTALVFPSVL